MLRRGKRHRAWLARWVGGAVLMPMCGSIGAQALNLSDAWQLALQHDHGYRAALSEQAASQTERVQGRAGLLPQIQAGYRRSKVTGSAVQHDGARRTPSVLDYDSLNTYLQIQQPLLNVAGYARYQRGDARADMGTGVLRARYEEMGVRLATAYFAALLAYDGYVLQRSLVSSLTHQARAVEGLFRQQEATRIDVRETQSHLAVARADLIAASDRWTLALRELQALLGVLPTHLTALREDLPLPPLTPSTLDEWLDIATARNVEVAVARHAVRVAAAEVDIATGQSMPTADLVASYGRASNESLSSLSQRTHTFTVGVRVSFSLFDGGYNRAHVDRARSNRLRLEHELRAAVERTQAEVARQYAHARAGAELVYALSAAEASGRASLAAVIKGFSVGVAGNRDVLKVQDRLYRTRYELAKAQVDYVLAWLKLTMVAGMHQDSTFHDIGDVYMGRVVSLAFPDENSHPLKTEVGAGHVGYSRCSQRTACDEVLATLPFLCSCGR